MTAVDNTDAMPVYAVCDKRRDGRLRILAEFREPHDAREHARMLRWAGDPCEVLLVSRLEGEAAT